MQELKKECAGLDESGNERLPAAVAWSLQRYLVLAILSCVPGELKEGKWWMVGWGEVMSIAEPVY